MKRILFVSLLPLLLLGCGAYYTKDTYFGPTKSPDWEIKWSDKSRSTVACNNVSAEFLPINIESKKTSEAIFGIPIYPSSEIISEYNTKQPIIIEFFYKGYVGDCNTNDVSIKLNESSNILQPTEANTLAYYKTDNITYCRYWFNEKYSSANIIDVYVSTNKLRCNSHPLRLKRITSSRYNFQPW